MNRPGADDLSLWQRFRGAGGRWRRQVRRGVLEPILVGNRTFRETVLNALSARGHLVFCEFPEGKFFVDPADRVVGTSLMWRGDWQRRELVQAVAILRQAGQFRAGKTFVDAGANIGTHTVYALTGGSFARAIAFEPEPQNLRLLTMNVEVNELSDRVAVVGAALGNVAGQARLHLHPRNQAAHSIGRRPSYDGTASVDVAVVRLDAHLRDLVAPDDIGLVWIDVEGFEPEVVEGLGDYLGRVPLVIEYAPPRYSAQQRRAFDAMLAANYQNLFRLGGEQPQRQPLDALSSFDDEIIDILVF